MAFNFLNRNWKRIIKEVLQPQPDAAIPEDLAEQTLDRAPTLWLLGKVQSGKTSIIHAITRHPEAEIGAGFKPCTRHARAFEFPPELPLVRFLDTRGLGELNYSPEAELENLAQQADAVLVVARALDPQQEEVFGHLRRLRKHNPQWPVILVQTRLHDAYPDDRDHPDYDALMSDPDLHDLQRALKAQADELGDLPGDGPVHTVAVDLTRPEDGFSDPDYGLEALLDALDQVLDDAQRQQLRSLTLTGGSERLRQLHPHLVGYAMAAGLTDMIPVAGFVTVPTLQGKMLHSIGHYYGRHWDRTSLTEFATSLGSGTLLGIGASFGARQLGKLVPVYGQSVGAVAAGTASATVTYALGRAACYYLEQAELGETDPAGVADAYRGSLKEAWQLFHNRLGKASRDQEPKE
ncbi:YcjF family protein [Saccharospirillum salsuginis]|uniref:Kinase n=1 Tax=Saccharospirillum salsuginis TaxID=418750 RepID=A0A918KT14_9GAMM|nr:GTPase [Saccharospirillum salsuginis]GGX75041.1 kinase [Saccharospirillum salsuginis]